MRRGREIRRYWAKVNKERVRITEGSQRDDVLKGGSKEMLAGGVTELLWQPHSRYPTRFPGILVMSGGMEG